MAEPTIDKETANYRHTESENIRCGSCARFVAEDNHCHKVKGTIEAEYVCDLFKHGEKSMETAQEILNGKNPVQALRERFTTGNIGMGKHRFTNVLFDPRQRYVKPERMEGIILTINTDEVEGLEKGQSYRITQADIENWEWEGPNELGELDPPSSEEAEGTLTLRPVGTNEDLEMPMGFMMDLFAAGLAV